MKLHIFVLLSVLASIAGAWRIDDRGWVNNFIWPQDSKDLLSFSSQQKLSFHDSYFENFTHAIADQFTNVKELRFHTGTVLHLQLKKNIEILNIQFSKTKIIEILPDDEYATVKLRVSDCYLKSIPMNINRLRRLKTLDLSYNKIDYVQISDFSGLNNLEELWLSANEMKTLSSKSTIQLPKLRRFYLDYNFLREINVCSWDMPTLEKILLQGNELKFVTNLVDQFPKLSEISIYDNPFVCQWKDNVVRSLQSKNISLGAKEVTCNATDETHVPTECPAIV